MIAMAAHKSEEKENADDRVPLAPVVPDAYRRRGGIEQWRFWGPLALVAVLLVWRGADAWLQVLPGKQWNSPGRLAGPHALYDTNCAVCHPGYTPISDADWVANLLHHNHSADPNCKSCHAGADHNNKENPDLRPACSACHLEHNGRDASLVRTRDAHCLSCHKDLTLSLAANAKTPYGNVLRFAQGSNDHPEFRLLRDNEPDPRRLHFNHKLHMTPGMRRTEKSEPYTLAQVDAPFRDLYGKDKPATSEVNLRCDSCHQLDGRDFKAPAEAMAQLPKNALAPPRPPGAIMLPIVYEKHCQACHPLSYERTDRDSPQSGKLVAPHRLQPPELRKYLEAVYTDKLLGQNPPVARVPFPPLPGKPVGPEQKAFMDQLGNLVQRAEQDLYSSKRSCGECHISNPPLNAGSFNPTIPPEGKIEPTKIPEIWFEHAAFDHEPHRQLNCEQCHVDASKRNELELPERSKPPMLPGKELCLTCHSPRAPGGGARSDCVACHRYHDGDNPLSGLGSASRAGPNAGTRDLRKFIGN
jgi:Cytochrome c7 and related cytochrome c